MAAYEPKLMEKKSFLRSKEGIILSYNYTDVAEGTGIVIYNGTTTKNDTTLAYALSTQSLYSNNITTSGSLGASSTAFQKFLDLDFDLSTFSINQIIEGTAYCQLCFEIKHTGGADATSHEAYVLGKIRKWDGVSETEIASGQSETITCTGIVGNYTLKIINVKIPVSKVSFKVGDILRFTAEVWSKRTGVGTGDTVYVGHDPVNREEGDFTAANDAITKMEIHIPYKLDL